MLTGISATPRLDAELLMADALGVSRSDLLLRHASSAVPARFADYLRRRSAHEPVAYILGHQEFFGRAFAVNSHVLIPRADSETVVQAALDAASGAGTAEARVLDLGTGSGALLLTVLAECEGWTGTGIDASAGAVAVAQTNAQRLGLAQRAQILRRDWTEDGWADGLGTFDLVLANPPYVESGAVLERDVRDHEPASALFAGEEGLDDYRVILPQLRALMKQGGVAVLEIGYRQAETVGALARQAGFACTLRRDLADRPRALVLR
jgi:release factor glutamine methyltransferase